MPSAQEVTQQLQSSPAVLVEEYGRIIGIITRHDVLDLKLGNTGLASLVRCVVRVRRIT